MNLLGLSSIVQTVSTKLGKFQSIIVIAVVLFLLIGFKFQTPSSRFDTLQAQQVADRSKTDSALKEVDARYWAQQRLIEGLVRMQCYKEPVNITDLAGLPCQALGAVKP